MHKSTQQDLYILTFRQSINSLFFRNESYLDFSLLLKGLPMPNRYQNNMSNKDFSVSCFILLFLSRTYGDLACGTSDISLSPKLVSSFTLVQFICLDIRRSTV